MFSVLCATDSSRARARARVRSMLAWISLKWPSRRARGARAGPRAPWRVYLSVRDGVGFAFSCAGTCAVLSACGRRFPRRLLGRPGGLGPWVPGACVRRRRHLGGAPERKLRAHTASLTSLYELYGPLGCHLWPGWAGLGRPVLALAGILWDMLPRWFCVMRRCCAIANVWARAPPCRGGAPRARRPCGGRRGGHGGGGFRRAATWRSRRACARGAPRLPKKKVGEIDEVRPVWRAAGCEGPGRGDRGCGFGPQGTGRGRGGRGDRPRGGGRLRGAGEGRRRRRRGCPCRGGRVRRQRAPGAGGPAQGAARRRRRSRGAATLFRTVDGDGRRQGASHGGRHRPSPVGDAAAAAPPLRSLGSKLTRPLRLSHARVVSRGALPQ